MAKCRKHKIEKRMDIGGMMFCEKCIKEGAERLSANITPFLIFEEMKTLPRYKQTNGKWGFMFTYEDYLKLRRRFVLKR